MHTFQMNSQINENGILTVALPKEWAKQVVNIVLIVEPLAQEKSTKINDTAQRKERLKNALNNAVALDIADKFFEQLRLDDDFADDELALLFERDKDTGRDAL